MPIEVYEEGTRRLDMLSQASKAKISALLNESGIDPEQKQNRLEKSLASVLAVQTMKDLMGKIGDNISQADMEVLLAKDSLQKTAKDIFDSPAFGKMTKKMSDDDYLGIATDEEAVAKSYKTLSESSKKHSFAKEKSPAKPKQMMK